MGAGNFVRYPGSSNNSVAPHNLNARPIIISDDTEIKLKVDGRESEFLMSLDSRIITHKNSSEITIKKAHSKSK